MLISWKLKLFAQISCFYTFEDKCYMQSVYDQNLWKKYFKNVAVKAKKFI